MSIHISKLKIDSFRGINNLEIENLNHINIVAGDNNCGKTSVLEALLLLRNPKEFSNVLRIVRVRNGQQYAYRANAYQGLMSLFPHKINDEDEIKNISIKAKINDDVVECSIRGNEKTVMVDDVNGSESGYINVLRKLSDHEIPSECLEFQGEQVFSINGDKCKNTFSFKEIDPVGKFEISKNQFINVVYLSPFNHLEGNLFNQIISNDTYKEVCIKVLQEFDPNIQDLLLLKDKYSSSVIECVRHREIGVMPLSTYGDGIKKVLSIASGIARAAGGILLIDEIETSIHAKYYPNIFLFILLSCKKFNVQVFVTTHSIEAIDSFLAIQNYDKQTSTDDINIITIKKEEKKSFSRVLSGRHVYENREQFGFEVRL